MTREEEIKQAAYAQYCNSESICFTLLCNSFKQGAEWADNHPKSPWMKFTGELPPPQEPTYRPFKDREECWAEMQKHQPFGWLIDKNTKVYHSIVALNNICPYFSNGCGDEYEHLFECAAFADGTPFGIKEE